jgi:hypothetical protein
VRLGPGREFAPAANQLRARSASSPDSKAARSTSPS